HRYDGDRYGFAGPGYHIVTLARTHDFWDDRSTEVYDAAYAEIEGHLDALAAALTADWAAPVTVDLTRYLQARVEQDADTPEPIPYLSTYTGEMLVWRPPGDRFIALSIVQNDTEFPLELVVGVGEAAILDGDA